MTTKQLRNKILDLAIHGKLVEKEGEWEEKTGKEIFEPLISTKPSGEYFNYIDIDAIDNKQCRIITPKKLLAAKAPSRASRHTQKGDVLFSMVRPYLRNIAIVEEDNCIASTGFYVCRTKLMIPKFCYYLMISEYVVLGLNVFMKGDNSPSITNKNILDFKFPLPPLAEQRRIVAAVEQWMSLVDVIESGQENLQQSIALAKNKILDLAIHGRLVEKEGEWEEKTLGEVCKIVMGQSPSGDSLNNNKGVEFHQGKLSFGEKYLEESGIFTSKGNKYAELDSIVLCVRAPVGIPNITKRRICIGRGLCALHCEDKINLHYLYCVLLTLKTYFEEKATGSTFKSISGDIIKKATIPLPPLAEQRRIVAKVEELFTQLDNIANALK